MTRVVVALLIVLSGCSESELATATGTLKSIDNPPAEIAEPGPTEAATTEPASAAAAPGDEAPTPAGPVAYVEDSPRLSPALAQRAQGVPALRILSPTMGETVTSPVLIRVEADRFQLAAKGVSRDGEGHAHVLVDEPCVDPGEVILEDHQHIGDGANEFEVDLPVGGHTLCIQIGDGFHSALDITASVNITVVAPG